MKITEKRRKLAMAACNLTFMGKREERDVWIVSIPEENISGSPGPGAHMELELLWTPETVYSFHIPPLDEYFDVFEKYKTPKGLDPDFKRAWKIAKICDTWIKNHISMIEDLGLEESWPGHPQKITFH